MTGLSYLDSSALVKLVAKESGSGALRRFLRGRGRIAASALARTEVLRAVRAYGPDPVRRARTLLTRIDLISLSDEILDRAATIDPLELRSLDAIHVTCALSLGDALGAFVTYDTRQAAAARAVGLNVEMPT